MNIKLIAATAALLACATPGFTAPVTMTFEGTSSTFSVDNYYNGGTDGNGQSGANHHVAFGLDVLAFTNDQFTTYFSGPAELGNTVIAPVGPLASMSAASGFSFFGPISFFYSATDAFSINAFDKNGANVGSVNLLATNGSCTPEIVFCSWSQATLNLTGLAKTVDFSGGVGIAGFDNITASVPAPAPAVLMASGLLMLVRSRLRRQRAL